MTDYTDHDVIEDITTEATPTKKVPFDRLPEPTATKPPKASPYHTERAERARNWVKNSLPTYLAEAQSLIFAAGGRRANNDVADVIDHNAGTLACALAYVDTLAPHGLTIIDSHAIDPKTGLGTEADALRARGEGKFPRGTQWQNRASGLRDTVVSFWTGEGKYPPSKAGDVYPFAKANAPRNVSIVLPEGCNMFVLDVDGPTGAASLKALTDEHGELPVTPHSITGSGGSHYLFKCKRPIRNTASRLADKIDIRGEGGQIIAPPSVHKTGGFYIWAEGCAPWEVAVADAPEWLEELAFTASKANSTKGKATAKGKAKKKAGNKGGRASARADTVGFDAHLANIGDHAGGGGFDITIYRAACSWWSGNPDGDADELFDLLRDRIDEAERDEDRDRTKYDTDDYVVGRIEAARVFIASQAVSEVDASIPFDMAAPLGETLDEALEALERGFKYVKVGSSGRFLRVLAPGERPVLDFFDVKGLADWYANQKVDIVDDYDEDGDPIFKSINPVPVYFNRARRYSDIQFAPAPAQVGENTFNLFRGFSVEPQAGDCTVLKEFIRDVICAGDQVVFDWVWMWLAHMVQRPGEKPGTALVIWGEGGAGKGIFGELVRSLVAPYGVLFGRADDVTGKFSGPLHVMNIVGVSEEATFSGDPRVANELKSKITAPTLMVEAKHAQPIEMNTSMRYIIDSNHANAVNIEGNNSERRFCVCKVSSHRVGDLDYLVDTVLAAIRGDELKALMHELQNYKPEGGTWKAVRIAPLTEDRKAMRAESLKGVHDDFMDLIEDGEFIWRDVHDEFRFTLSEDDESRIPSRYLDAFIKRTGDSRDAGQRRAGRVFERLFGLDLPKRKARVKAERKSSDIDNPELVWLDYEFAPVQSYIFPPLRTLWAIREERYGT
jgi:hypothetical protein